MSKHYEELVYLAIGEKLPSPEMKEESIKQLAEAVESLEENQKVIIKALYGIGQEHEHILEVAKKRGLSENEALEILAEALRELRIKLTNN